MSKKRSLKAAKPAPEPPKRGRKTLYTPQIVQQIAQYIELGNTQADAAALVGIHIDTLMTWKNKKPELTEAIKSAQARCRAQHIANVRRHAFGLEGVAVRWTASAWWLERTDPERFGQRVKNELTGEGGSPFVVEIRRFGNPKGLRPGVQMPEKTGTGNGNGNGTNGHH